MHSISSECESTEEIAMKFNTFSQCNHIGLAKGCGTTDLLVMNFMINY